MKRSLLIVCLLWGFLLQAQHQSKLGRFSLPFAKACAPVTIHISSHDPYGNIARTYSYEQDENTTDTSYTYTTPGIYRIVQFLGADIDPKTDTLTFEVVESSNPEFHVFWCSSTSVQVALGDSPYDYHVVHFSPTDSVIVMPGDADPVYDYGQSTGTVEVAGYYTNAYPNCGSTFQSFTIASPQPPNITSATILEGCEGTFFIAPEVNADQNTKYQLAFQQGTQAYTTIFEGALTSDSGYPVHFELSDPEYCIRISSINACNGTLVASETLCGSINLGRIRPLNAAYAGYLGSEILIHIDGLENAQFLVERKSTNAETFGFLKVTNGSFTDQNTSPFSTFDYRIVQEDTCGNSIDSTHVTPPYSRITDKNMHKNTVTFSVSDPVNSLGDFTTSYLVYNPDSANSALIPFNPTVALPATIGSTQVIRVAYFYPASELTLYSNAIRTSYETRIYVPRAFTPNGDRLNDELELFGLPTNAFEISIYNRWGELIHATQNENPVWDGYLDEHKAPQGTYRYKLIFTLADGEVKTQVGTFVVLMN